jgi:hypothetical protein
VYVHVRSVTAWSLQAYIKAPNAGAGDYFGYAVSLSADTLAIGAYAEGSCSTTYATNDDNCYSAGAAYVYVRSGTVWSFEAYIKASNPVMGYNFGWAVSLVADTLAVSAKYERSCSTSIATTESHVQGDCACTQGRRVAAARQRCFRQ